MILSMTKRAFTLIELLVVIAIISIIAAILFPVFAQAREKARQITCTSNEKQLSLGVLMYAQDNDETLPPVATPGNMMLWNDMINPYVKNTRVRVCPSDPAANAVNSYGLNELAFVDLDDNAAAAPVSLAIFTTPADTVMLGELGTANDFKTELDNAFKLVAPDGLLNDAPDDARPSARHFNRANLAFMDGHVKAKRLEDFYTGQTPLDKWFCPNPENVAGCHS